MKLAVIIDKLYPEKFSALIISFEKISCNNIILVFFIVKLIFLGACSTSFRGMLEEPKHDTSDYYIKHYAYSLVYNEKYEQAEWVAYQLIESELTPNFKRTNRFLKDTMVKTGTADNSDYKGTGYDKGHLAPAADMAWNEQAMQESFYFSNISPQLPSFNRGIWKQLEGKVREWVKIYNRLYITTGPICKGSELEIGRNGVCVPTYFYKTILIYNDSIKQSIGFIFPHEKCEGELFEYAVSVDSIESITGLNLYYRLPSSNESYIEGQYNFRFWNK